MPPLAKVVMQDDMVVVGATRLLVEDALDVKTGSFPLLEGAFMGPPEAACGGPRPFDADTGVSRGRGNVSLVIFGDGS